MMRMCILCYVHTCMHDLFSTDPTLTYENIYTVTATVPVEGDELGDLVLGIPKGKREEIHQQSSSAAQEREKLLHYYLNYSPYASWSRLAGRLYIRKYHDVLTVTKNFIKDEPGEFILCTCMHAWQCDCTWVIVCSMWIHCQMQAL